MTDETLMDREPIRLPVWSLGPLSVLFGLVLDLLNHVEWKASLAGAVLALGSLLGIGEVARRRAVSPVTAQRRVTAAKRETHREIRVGLEEMAASREKASAARAQTKRSRAGRPTAPSEKPKKRR